MMIFAVVCRVAEEVCFEWNCGAVRRIYCASIFDFQSLLLWLRKFELSSLDPSSSAQWLIILLACYYAMYTACSLPTIDHRSFGSVKNKI